MHRLPFAAVMFAAAAASAAPCAIIENHPKILTAANAVIDDGGGIVVGTLPDYDRTAAVNAIEELHFSDGSKPVIKHIAPGLDVLATSGKATLEGKQRVISVTHGKVAAVSAPAVKSIVREAPAQVKHPYVLTHAEIIGELPTGVIALVVFDKAGTTARSWGAVGATISITVYDGGSCTHVLPGTVDSHVGDEVRVAWVDASGRLSKLSTPIAVR